MNGPETRRACGCGCDGYASPIDAGIARSDVRRYRASGPDGTTRMLLDMIEVAARPGMTLLDVGGGIGVIDQELLRGSVSRAVLVEATPEYVEAAGDLARASGLDDRLAVVAADFVRHAGAIEPADIVTLDRVVCCYPDAAALVSASVARARDLYGLVLPRDRWWVRWSVRAENVIWRLRRRGYRAHAHAHAGIESLLEAQGLRLRAEATTFFWRVVLFAREDSSEAAPSSM